MQRNEPNAYGLTMNGGLIVDAVLEELINKHDLLSATNIIFREIRRWSRFSRTNRSLGGYYRSSVRRQGYSAKLQPPKVSAIAYAGFHYFHTHTFYDPRDQMSIGENKNSDDDSKDADNEEAAKDKPGREE